MKGNNTQSLPPMRNQDSNAFIIDPNEKANLLNDYFVSQTILPNKETIPTLFLARKTDCILSDISITQDAIREILYSINRNKAQYYQCEKHASPPGLEPGSLEYRSNALTTKLRRCPMKKHAPHIQVPEGNRRGQTSIHQDRP